MTVLAVFCAILAAQAFFSMAESSLALADAEELHGSARSGMRGARVAIWFIAAPEDRLLPTTLIGTNLCILANAIWMAFHLIGAPALVMGAGFLAGSAAIVIFGRVLPRTLGEELAEGISSWVAIPLRCAHFMFRPLALGLSSIVGSLSRAFGLEHARLVVTREEIEKLLRAPRPMAEAGTEGEITEPERSMIARIFAFGERTVYDGMAPLSETAAVPEDSSMDDAIAEIQDKRHTRMPVYRERLDQIVGVLHAFDVLKAKKGATIAEVARPPMFVPESQPLIELLPLMRSKNEGLAVVVDEYGGATGILTVEDILEEIVGPIEDEFDAKPSLIREEASGVFRVAGRTSVAEVNRVLKTTLPEGEDYESIAGLMLEKLRRIPRESESLRLGGVTLTVAGASERAVEEVILRVRG